MTQAFIPGHHHFSPPWVELWPGFLWLSPARESTLESAHRGLSDICRAVKCVSLQEAQSLERGEEL